MSRSKHAQTTNWSEPNNINIQSVIDSYDPNIHKQRLSSIQTISGNGQILDDMDDDDEMKWQCDQLESTIPSRLEDQKEEQVERYIFSHI